MFVLRLSPQEGEDGPKKEPRARGRPLYDIPYMFEAREFMRKKLIGKKVAYFSLSLIVVCLTLHLGYNVPSIDIDISRKNS